MDIHTSSVHELHFNSSGAIEETSGRVLDLEAYSRMKHGSRSDTKRFANQMTESITRDMPAIMSGESPPLFLVPYKAVQPACGYLSRYALDVINEERVERGYHPGEILKVHKGEVAVTDYSKASVAERLAELSQTDLSIKGVDVADRTLVVLDDIRISGGAERRMMEVIEQAGQVPAQVMLGYIALFDARQAKEAPHVESDINSVAVQSAADVTKFMMAGDFDLNIRTLKLILSARPDVLAEMVSTVDPVYIEEIVRGAADTGPDFVKNYVNNYTYLRNVVVGRRSQTHVVA